MECPLRASSDSDSFLSEVGPGGHHLFTDPYRGKQLTDRRLGPSDTKRTFEALYAAHHRAVLAYCARRAPRWDAWDAAAEVFLVAWRRIDEVPPEDQARAWLFGVAYRVLSNQRRSAARRMRLAERAASSGVSPRWPDEVVVQSEEAVEVNQALNRLRPIDREVLQLTLWEELSPVEIADVLGVSRAAVDQRYSRAKHRLAQELNVNRNVARRAIRVTTGRRGVA